MDPMGTHPGPWEESLVRQIHPGNNNLSLAGREMEGVESGCLQVSLEFGEFKSFYHGNPRFLHF